MPTLFDYSQDIQTF